MSFFSNFLKNFQSTKNETTSKTGESDTSIAQLSDISGLTESNSIDDEETETDTGSSTESDSNQEGDPNSEADINTLKMVEVMQKFKQAAEMCKRKKKFNRETFEVRRQVERFNNQDPKRVKVDDNNLGYIDPKLLHKKSSEVHSEERPRKEIEIKGKKYVLSKRGRHIHENLWCKSRA